MGREVLERFADYAYMPSMRHTRINEAVTVFSQTLTAARRQKEKVGIQDFKDQLSDELEIEIKILPVQ